MSTEPSWLNNLPDPTVPLPAPEALAFHDEVDDVLAEVKSTVDNRYSGHIEALPTKTTRLGGPSIEPVAAGSSTIVNYAMYLSFSGRNHFSYRLFELISKKLNGGLPVDVVAFSGPPVLLGSAHTKAELQALIKQIFEDTRTRWIINTYYKN
ncbi:MAG: hypothetical protein M3Y54_11335 [Bacteroidota bacterium]|nr:hypothetical protein [Bacteroidota bacterium]